MYRNTTYQLIKSTSSKEKVVMETEASCIERAIDYFYLCEPKAYSNPKYLIRIKKNTFKDLARAWD